MCAAAKRMPMTLARKIPGTNSGQAESDVQPELIGLKDAVEFRLTRHNVGEDHEQRAGDAQERGFADLAQEKTGVRCVGIVCRAIQRVIDSSS